MWHWGMKYIWIIGERIHSNDSIKSLSRRSNDVNPMRGSQKKSPWQAIKSAKASTAVGCCGYYRPRFMLQEREMLGMCSRKARGVRPHQGKRIKWRWFILELDRVTQWDITVHLRMSSNEVTMFWLHSALYTLYKMSAGQILVHHIKVMHLNWECFFSNVGVQTDASLSGN